MFKTRMIYAFSGLYQHAFDVDSEVYLSDELLQAYHDLGINGIWTQGVLSQLTEFPFDPSVSAGYEERLKRLQRLTERLDRYGIKLYLYINEPRCMPLAFFEKYPDIRGHVRGENASLCTSTEPVKEYLRGAIERICRAAPLIGGFFCITRSENQTNCYSHSGDLGEECTCPRCREKPVGAVVADTYFYENGESLLEESPYVEAEQQFSTAFREFPFYIDTLYRGPQNAGPSTLLFEKPTGYRSTMTCFAYDDVERWRSIYPLDVFEDQFRKLCEAWYRGLEMLPEGDEGELPTMARAAYCLFKSSLNQIRFVRARDDKRYTDAIVAAEDEIEVAKTMIEQMNANAAIGYEAANHYYFSKGQLAEKIVNCYHVIDVFKQQ